MPTNEPKPPASETCARCADTEATGNGRGCITHRPCGHEWDIRCRCKPAPPAPEPAGTTVEELARKPCRYDSGNHDYCTQHQGYRANACTMVVDAARERIEELTRERDAARRVLILDGDAPRRADAAESALATARGLLEAAQGHEIPASLRLDIRAFLSPPSAPERPAEPPPSHDHPWNLPPEGEARRHAFVGPTGAHAHQCLFKRACHHDERGGFCDLEVSAPIHQGAEPPRPCSVLVCMLPEGHDGGHRISPPAEEPGEEFARKSARLYAILDEATKLVATWPAWKREYFALAPAAPGRECACGLFGPCGLDCTCKVCHPPTPAEAKENER